MRHSEHGASAARPAHHLAVHFVTRFFDNPGGGIGRYERELVHELCRVCEVETVRAEPWPVPRWLVRLARLVGRDLETVLRENRAYVAGPRKGALFHLSYQELAASLLWQRYQAPTVVTVHDIIPVVARGAAWSTTEPDLVERAILWQWTRGLRRADHLIAVSHWTKSVLTERLGIPPERISVVHQSVNAEAFNANGAGDSAAMQETGVRPGDRYLLHVGSLHLRKDVPTLLKALSQARISQPDVNLVLAGASRTDPGREAHIQSEVRRLNLSNAVISTGTISDATLAALYRHAAALVMSSRYEGFGFPLIEAMACGCPVVSSDASCLPEIVGDAGLLFPAGDVNALAAQIVSLLNQLSLADDLRERGVRRALYFSPERRCRQTIEVYADLLRGRDARV